tara:strand:+ start:7942 stop:8277 length:336 start_codon:yes stop_codon:yes gene_type:complete
VKGLAILEEAKASGLYDALIIQLNKDFLRAGLSEQFDEHIKPEALMRNLQATLYEQILSDFESYLTLLYTIDVSEAKIKALPSMELHELTAIVTTLILERELFKISFKNKP